MNYTPMIEFFPEPCSVGQARVVPFEISEQQAAIYSFRDRFIRPGRYCKLIVDGVLMMSDTPHEQMTNAAAVQNANGDVLIAGLGLGMILVPILRKPTVTSVTVIEKNSDVIALIEPRMPERNKLTIINTDIFQWKPKGPNARWDFIYFDIWPEITGDNYPEMKTLHRRFGRRCTGIISSWCKEYCRRKHKEEERG